MPNDRELEHLGKICEGPVIQLLQRNKATQKVDIKRLLQAD
jgi:hypothetical protein